MTAPRSVDEVPNGTPLDITGPRLIRVVLRQEDHDSLTLVAVYTTHENIGVRNRDSRLMPVIVENFVPVEPELYEILADLLHIRSVRSGEADTDSVLVCPHDASVVPFFG